MYKVIRTFSRPNTNVEFWSENHSLVSQSYRTYRQETYVDTGKLVSKTEELSQDGLLRTVTATWLNQDDFEYFITDPRIVNEFEIPGSQYMNDNGIELIARSSQVI